DRRRARRVRLRADRSPPGGQQTGPGNSKASAPPPHLNAKQFGTRVRWASNFGGVTRGETHGHMARHLIASLLRSPDYSVRDVVRTVRGITATQAALLPELAELDLTRTLPSIDVPVVVVQG